MNKILFTAFAIGTLCAGTVALPALSAETAKPASPTPAHPPQPAAPAYDEQAEAEYQHCLKLATTRPDDGYEEALAWGSMGGGEAALHCGAIARIGQKQYADGAKRLEKLSRESHRPDAIRAQMLAQAAQAWVLDGNYDQANTDQVAALAIDPENADIRVDHAVTLGQVHHYKEALAELDKVLQTQSYRLDALILRASAHRYLDDRKAAMDDVERALSFDPNNPDALVERGILRRLNGDDKGARADWLAVIKAVPSGPIFDEAQRNLQLLDDPGAAKPAK